MSSLGELLKKTTGTLWYQFIEFRKHSTKYTYHNNRLASGYKAITSINTETKHLAYILCE